MKKASSFLSVLFFSVAIMIVALLPASVQAYPTEDMELYQYLLNPGNAENRDLGKALIDFLSRTRTRKDFVVIIENNSEQLEELQQEQLKLEKLIGNLLYSEPITTTMISPSIATIKVLRGKPWALKPEKNAELKRIQNEIKSLTLQPKKIRQFEIAKTEVIEGATLKLLSAPHLRNKDWYYATLREHILNCLRDQNETLQQIIPKLAPVLSTELKGRRFLMFVVDEAFKKKNYEVLIAALAEVTDILPLYPYSDSFKEILQLHESNVRQHLYGAALSEIPNGEHFKQSLNKELIRIGNFKNKELQLKFLSRTLRVYVQAWKNAEQQNSRRFFEALENPRQNIRAIAELAARWKSQETIEPRPFEEATKQLLQAKKLILSGCGSAMIGI